jgi:transposase InsO family protein
VYPQPTACWQLDATEYVLTGGRKCVIFQLIDDDSRLAVTSHVAWRETSEAAMAVVTEGITARGGPQRLLSDNGAALNPSRRGCSVRWCEGECALRAVHHLLFGEPPFSAHAHTATRG